MIKKILKFILKKIKNIFFNFLIFEIYKDKTFLPRKGPYEIYEIFKNINKKKFFKDKIILPYIDLNNFNIMNIHKPYEILEIFNLTKDSSKNFKINKPNKNLILPLALLDKSNHDSLETDIISISYGKFKYNLELKYKNRFHYLPLFSDKKIDNVKIKSSKNSLAIGKPLNVSKMKSSKQPNLIVHIFIDAFAQSIIEKYGYEIIPNTSKFFRSGGVFFTNAYAQSEWTLSSAAGIFTGKYTNEHFIYHPRNENKIKETTIADTLQNEGYFTFGCTNIPKLSPYNGFDKGFDRLILATDQNYNYILNEAFNQLESFGGKQYMFLGFFDIHESHRLPPVSSQLMNNLNNFQFKKLIGNSKSTNILYDEDRIEFYKNNITYFDKKLKRLFEKINLYDSKAIVALHSDHGVNFMTKTTELLGKEREKVVFLYKSDKKSRVDNQIKEIRALPNMLCNDLNIKNNFNYQNNGYAITESLYPEKDYEIAVRDNKNVLFFKVSWNDFIQKYSNKFNTSYHLLDNEEISIDKDHNQNKLLNIAKKHYLKTVKNFNKP